MVHLVLVSHSQQLAQAVADLARQMSSPDLKIAVTGGMGEDRQEFGTDAMQIMAAIEEVYTDDGVVVLMDLGSAVLSAKLAVELLPEEWQKQIILCAAPFVEGAVSASVQASLGSDLQAVCREALGALQPKIEQIEPEAEEDEAPDPKKGVQATGQGQVRRMQLTNTHGLHARPAAKFVKAANRFNAEITVTNLTKNKGPVSAKSMNALATLGAVQGDEISLSAEGEEAEAALDTLSDLVRTGFDEELPEPSSIRPLERDTSEDEGIPSGPNIYAGVPVSDGVALAPIVSFHKPTLTVPEFQIDDPDRAYAQFEEVVTNVKEALQTHRDQIARQIGADNAAIFDAHLQILQDPELIKAVRTGIYEHQLNPAFAWQQAIEPILRAFQDLKDDYLKERAADVRSVKEQVLAQLTGVSLEITIDHPDAVILYAKELTPLETTQLDLNQIQGIVTQTGGPMAHYAILARSLGIPAITGVDQALSDVADGTPVFLDGFQGYLWANPPEDIREAYPARRTAWLENREGSHRENT